MRRWWWIVKTNQNAIPVGSATSKTSSNFPSGALYHAEKSFTYQNWRKAEIMGTLDEDWDELKS
jgi:hypothetical protein